MGFEKFLPTKYSRDTDDVLSTDFWDIGLYKENYKFDLWRHFTIEATNILTILRNRAYGSLKILIAAVESSTKPTQCLDGSFFSEKGDVVTHSFCKQ